MAEVTEWIEEARLGRFRRYPAYRDSGVEWLGEIPAHWDVNRLKFLAPTRTEKLTTKPGDAVYVGLEHVESWTGRLLLEAQPDSVESVVSSFSSGDVLLGKLRPYLAKAARPNFDGVCTGEILALRPNRGCVQSYLMYSLLNISYVRWLDSLTYGSKMPRVSPTEVDSSRAPLPPEIEQQAIASFLDRETAKIDELVAKQERLIELLQEKRTALITRAVTRGLDPNVPMKDSGVKWLGEIPAHWHVRTLKRISPEITVGVVVNPSMYVRIEGVPFLYGSDIHEGRIVADGARRMSEEDSKSLNKSRLRAGDLVCVRVGAPGVTAVVPPRLAGANCASVLIVRHADSFDSQWLCYGMNSRLVRYQVELVQYGAAQEQFNVAHAVQFFVLLAPQTEQRAIAAFLDRETAKIDALIAKVRRATDHLKEYRTALISATVTGKIDVRNEAA